MTISEDRQSHLARLLVDGIWNDDLVDYTDDDTALRLAKKGLAKFVAEGEEIDKQVRDKLVSLRRGVVEGSPEWDVLYGKYYDEEMVRRGTS
ncbi:MAG: DUF507 family protein [Bdellovibrionales bacterium]